MNLVYFDPYPNKKLEAYIKQYGELLQHNGEAPVFVKRVETVEEVLKEADVSGGGRGMRVWSGSVGDKGCEESPGVFCSSLYS